MFSSISISQVIHVFAIFVAIDIDSHDFMSMKGKIWFELSIKA